MSVEEYRQKFFAKKNGIYEVIFSSSDNVNSMGVFTVYKIQAIKNPKEPVTDDKVNNNSRIPGGSKSNDKKYVLDTGDRIKIIENIRYVKEDAQSGKEFEVDLSQVIWKDGQQFDDLSNYYCWTIHEGIKKIKPYVEQTEEEEIPLEEDIETPVEEPRIPTEEEKSLPQISLSSNTLTKVDLQFLENNKGLKILKIEDIPGDPVWLGHQNHVKYLRDHGYLNSHRIDLSFGHYTVIDIENYRMKVNGIANNEVGKTIDHIISKNTDAIAIINGTFFNDDIFLSEGYLISDGIVQNTSLPRNKVEEKINEDRLLNEIIKKVKKKQYFALDPETGDYVFGKGHPPPKKYKTCIGGLLKNWDPQKFGISVKSITGLSIIGYNKKEKTVLLFSLEPQLIAPLNPDNIEKRIEQSGFEMRYLDGGTSVTLYTKDTGVSVRGERHKGTPVMNDTVTSYILFVPKTKIEMDEISSYLLDDKVIMEEGAVDSVGASNYGKIANTPESYVYDLQTHLKDLGFLEVGIPDGDFGSKTKNALISFQRVAASGIRMDTYGSLINVMPKFTGEPTEKVDKHTREEVLEWLNLEYTKSRIYGCYNLRKGDKDSKKKWGGIKRESDDGHYIEDLQRDLVKLGYWISSPSKDFGMLIDGIYGDKVYGAVWLFQKEHGLNKTGEVDLETASNIHQTTKDLREGEMYRRPGNFINDELGEFYQLPPSMFFTHDAPQYSEQNYLIDIWGKKTLIECIIKTAKEWVTAGNEKFRVGDLSKENDGNFLPHSGHRNGEVADIKSYDYCNLRNNRFNRKKSKDLAEKLFDNGIRQILFNCKYVIDEFTTQNNREVCALADHHHHFHINLGEDNIRIHEDQYCINCIQFVNPTSERRVLNNQWLKLSEGMTDEEKEEYNTQEKKDEYVKEHSNKCFYENRVNNQ